MTDCTLCSNYFTCQACVLPKVPADNPSSCVLPSCGNKRQIGEDCDDGNLNDGDGCSSSCTIESGYSCIGNFGSYSHCQENCGDGNLNPG